MDGNFTIRGTYVGYVAQGHAGRDMVRLGASIARWCPADVFAPARKLDAGCGLRDGGRLVLLRLVALSGPLDPRFSSLRSLAG